MHMTEANDLRAEGNAKRKSIRMRKGWKGFVWGYKDWIHATEDEGRWDKVNWGKDGEKSGAKLIERDPDNGRTIYRY